MRILTAQQTREAEAVAFEKYSTEAQLMLAAGTQCFHAMQKKYGKALEKAVVAVVCGNGKNAGDGFVMARLLHEKCGCSVTVILADKAPTIAEPLQYFQAMGEEVLVKQLESIDSIDADFIVDCIFGIGFHGEACPPFDRAFQLVNDSRAKVVAVDIPSGVNADDGSVGHICVQADLTVAVSMLKYGHVLPPGNAFCGEVRVVDIGIPQDCYSGDYAFTSSSRDIRRLFRPRSKNANKGTFGHQLNICSSRNMTGAGILCARGALRSGVGLLKCAFPKSCYPAYAANLPEALMLPLSENEHKTLSIGCINALEQTLDWADSIVLGCGLDINEDTQVIVSTVLKDAKCPVILDADGINILSAGIDLLEHISTPFVLTPHPGEMARLAGISIAEVQADRIGTAKRMAQKTGAVVVLKGANTVVTDGERVYINMTGNPGMAKAGMGDLLAGMIGAFAAQKMDLFAAAQAAVYIHGLCGDITARELSQRGMTVSDMAQLLGALMSEFE